MGLLGAFLLSQITRFQMLFRVVYFIPFVIASVVNASIWENLLDPELGIGPALASIGLPFLDGVAFFGDQRLALPSVAFVDNWHWWGFVLVLFLTAMQSVDRDLYDAAKVDGASRWHQFRHVTIPGIRPTLVFVVLMTIIWSLLAFDYIYIITQGGPAGATEVVATLMYKEAFARFEAGYAAALGLGMSFVSGLIVLGLPVSQAEGVGDLRLVSMGGRRTSREPSKVSYYAVLVALAFFALSPLVVLGFNSLKTSAELGRNPRPPAFA